ncbi:unnamed protein product [Orchesella dallaii]|uniref:Armadillo repeat-containing protein 6 n=1 Tax=Orchesella dallaii TaxID=48710 RepID=A0ABP1RFU8_9HEXA
MNVLLEGKPEVLDDVGWQIITQSLEKAASEHTHILGLKLTRAVCVQSEFNRELLTFNYNLMEPLLTIYSKHNRPSNLLLRQWCSTMKALLLSNDTKTGYNTAPERKRMIAKTKILPSLASKLHHSDYEHDEKTLNSIVILLATMAINDDLSNQIESGHVVQGIHSILKNHFHSGILVRNTISLLRYLCSSQIVRDKIASYALMKWVVEVMENYKKVEDIIEVAMSCCSYMTLRCSCQVAQLVAKNGLVVILQLIKDYKSNVAFLKSACITLRNMIENGDHEVKQRIKEFYAVVLSELMNQLELREYYVRPLLKELELNGEKVETMGEEMVIRPDTVSYEVRIGRKSVVLDDNTSAENLVA